MNSLQENQTPPIEIPLESLQPSTLEALIESYIQREGTDYGREEIPLERKISQLRNQLQKKEILVVFDFQSESVTLMKRTDWLVANRA